MTQGAIPNDQDRLMAALRALIRAEFPRLTFLGRFEYTISGVTGKAPSAKIDCKPVDATIGLPELNAVEYSPSVSGVTGTPKTGMACVVEFLDANPAKPRVCGLPSLGANPVARLGDQVVTFLPPALPVQGTVSGSPFVGVITIASPITGVISQGSGKVVSG